MVIYRLDIVLSNATVAHLNLSGLDVVQVILAHVTPAVLASTFTVDVVDAIVSVCLVGIVLTVAA